MRKILATLAFVFAASIIPAVVSAQQTSVFNCNKNGTATASAGSTVSLGGPYVPVADYAVELNTGLLVYKECVLRSIAVKERIAATAQINNKSIKQLNTGRDGEPYFVREIGVDELKTAGTKYLYNLQKGKGLEPLDDTLEDPVKRAIAQNYAAGVNLAAKFDCGYRGDLRSATMGRPQGDFWVAYEALSTDPACSFLSAYYLGDDEYSYQAAYEIYKNRTKLGYGQGWYPVEHIDENGLYITDTPASIVLANGIMMIQSSYKQLEAIDDIGQMIDGLYAGVANQTLAGATTVGGTGGFAGLSQSFGGLPSFMDQVSASASQGLVTTTNNAALAIVQEALRVERLYNASVTAMAGTLSDTIGSLRAREIQCMSLIATEICATDSIQGNKCTAKTGGQLTIATSSAVFSQKVIDTSIRSIATAAATNLNNSNTIITRLTQLVASLASSVSATVQQVALAQLAALQPHTGSDVARAQQDQQSVITMMASLLSKTSTDWGDSTDPKVGWCNYKNAAVVDAWTQCWGGNSSACITP